MVKRPDALERLRQRVTQEKLAKNKTPLTHNHENEQKTNQSLADLATYSKRLAQQTKQVDEVLHRAKETEPVQETSPNIKIESVSGPKPTESKVVTVRQAMPDKPKTEPIQEPEPVQETEPVQDTEPVQKTEPIQEPEPVQEPESVQENEPVQEPEPSVKTEPVRETESGQETDLPDTDKAVDEHGKQEQTFDDPSLEMRSRYLGIDPVSEKQQEIKTDFLKKIAERSKNNPDKDTSYVEFPEMDKTNHVKETIEKAKREGEQMRKKKEADPLDNLSEYVKFGKPQTDEPEVEKSKAKQTVKKMSLFGKANPIKDKNPKNDVAESESESVESKNPVAKKRTNHETSDSKAKLKKAGIAAVCAAAVLGASIGAGYIWSKVDEVHTPKQTQSAKPSSVKLKKAKKQSSMDDFKPAKKQSSKSTDDTKMVKPEIESSDNDASKFEREVQQKLNREAKATKQPYRITTAEIGGGYIQGVITYYPKDATKTYNDYSITAPKKAGSGIGDNRSRMIERKLKASLPKINKTINVRDKHKVTMRTYKQKDGSYNTILLYSNVPFAFVKTDKHNKMVNNVTTYYIQHVAKSGD